MDHSCWDGWGEVGKGVEQNVGQDVGQQTDQVVDQGCWEGWGGTEAAEEDSVFWRGEAAKQALKLQQVYQQMDLLRGEAEARDVAREELLLVVDRLKESNVNLVEELNRAKVREEELEANMELMTQELDDLKLKVVTVEGEKRKLIQLIDIERVEMKHEQRLVSAEKEERLAKLEKLVEHLEDENLNLQQALDTRLEPSEDPPGCQGPFQSQLLTPLIQKSFHAHKHLVDDTDSKSILLEHSYDLSYSSSPPTTSAGKAYSPATSLEDEMIACMLPKLAPARSRRAMNFSPETPHQSFARLRSRFASSPLQCNHMETERQNADEQDEDDGDMNGKTLKTTESILGMSVSDLLRHILRFHKIFSQSLMGRAIS